ncbi:MAG: hypothetical protein JWL90_3826 [Chthoniobacteraceae bacterium]|nr:hypothetical protein [Chthoniobacteraceae bacterium]MDB6174312.1 hypothetical protein [Chthoniobacteraceae bacterium]
MLHPTVASLLAVLPYYAYALILVCGASYFYRRTCRFSFTDELTERDNPAFGAAFTGYLTGVGIALTGAFPSQQTSLTTGLLAMTYSGVLVILLMRISIWVNDAFVLSRFSGHDEILRDRNMGAGVAVAGSSIGTGLVLAAIMTGESENYLLGIRDTLVYWAVGQTLFVAGAHLFFRIAGYDVQGILEKKKNTAAGISLGGFLTALGIFVWSVSRNASGNLLPEVGTTVVFGLIGGVVLLMSRVLTEKLILPRINFAKEISTDENNAAGLVSAACSIVTALMLAAAITA